MLHSNQTFEEASEAGAGPVFFTFGAIAKMWREQRFQSSRVNPFAAVFETSYS
jgi:hypothetical protein